ncbi:hypothetical protein VVR12_09845 [Rothia sp. LK2588]|uniref:hypothetical protein n=1 Tax=Rothia sp. LK2588 TaxID=3114369 RepID=UPI0034CE3F9C
MGIFKRRKYHENDGLDQAQQPVQSTDQKQTEHSAEDYRLEESTVAPQHERLTQGSGLDSLVQLMRDRGNGQLTLELKQEGNDMNLALFSDGNEVERTVVVPGNDWFESVASLYTDEERSERGAFNRALINADSATDRVQASFMNTETGTSNNLIFVDEKNASRGAETTRLGDESATTEAETATEAPAQRVHDTAGEDTAVQDERFSSIGQRLNSSEQDATAHVEKDSDQRTVRDDESFDAVAFGHNDDHEPADQGEAAARRDVLANIVGGDEDTERQAQATDAEFEKTEFARAEEPATEPTEDEAFLDQADQHQGGEFLADQQHGDQYQTEEPTGAALYTLPNSIITDPDSSFVEEEESKHESATSKDEKPVQESELSSETHADSAPLPEHIEEDFGAQPASAAEETSQTAVPTAAPTIVPAAAPAAAVASGAAPTASQSSAGQSSGAAPSAAPRQAPDSDLPSSAADVDVAPSYTRETETQRTKPSTTEKAEGNLVLTEAEVVSRLAEAQQALFGENGTARDVSTVLIRVRTLGSYYDALTHVRTGGFWDQRKTFDLVPEEVLNILQLKADSYSEGAGSPLAMSLRFTPGIPPQASFDYSNEEAFVKYSQQLPAQQYVEELRMFPRTGANIPPHMNQALTSWSF